MTKFQFWILAIGIWVSCGLILMWMIDGITIDNTRTDVHAEFDKSVAPHMVEIDNYVSDGTRFFVWVDTNTNVMYFGPSYGGISVMLDADGNPLIYEEE